MANRYLVGSGAFTSTSIWSTSYGGSSGASVPVSGDIIYVDNNYNITSGLPTGGDFDFIVRLGANNASSTTMGISGSPTFRTLDIRSANSAAHTVKFDTSANITADKFIAIGSNGSNRLNLNDGSFTTLKMTSGGSSSGNYVNINGLSASSALSQTQMYIGSNSVDTYSAGSNPWLFSNPPKISTLTDTFDTFDTSKWSKFTYRSGYVNIDSGKLKAGWEYTADSFFYFKSNGTYDLTSDTTYVKVDSLTGSQMYLTIGPVTQTGEVSSQLSATISETATTEYYRIKSTVSAGVANLVVERGDGASWTNVLSKSIDENQLKAVRLGVSGTRNLSDAEIVIDSIGTGPGPQADFSSDKSIGVRPLVVAFSDTSTLITPTTWAWTFGDGGTSTVQNPTHTYTNAGTYDVSLTVSDGATTKTVTKTGFITAQPEVFVRAISGTLLFGGSVARPAVVKVRSISGTLLFGGSVARPIKTTYGSISGSLLFGGSVKAIVIKDTQALPGKTYLYKIYDEDGTFVTVWKNDVITDPSFTHEINSIGSTMDIELAKTSDSLGTTTGPLQTEAGTNITTESLQNILASTQSRNQIGPNSSIQYNNRVDVYAYYGETAPLLTEGMEVIMTEDNETILASSGAPNGLRIFTGFISDINTRYGNTDTVAVQVTSYGWDLNQYPITNVSNETTVKFLSYDPSDIIREAMTKFVADSASYNTYTKATDTSVSTTASTVSYTFKANTYADVLDKTLELMPSNWYYYVGLGDNTVYFRERSVQPTHKFYLGKHIKALDLKGGIADTNNRVLFTGGGDPALYLERVEAPAPRTRRTLELYSDSRVTLTSSAEIIADGIIEDKNKVRYRTTIEILSGVYDIESLKVGETVGFRNFDNFVDSLTMQIVGINYSPDVAQLQLDSKPPTINKRLSDIYRNMKVQENQAVPDAPS